ncbi:MAG: outer membrane lipoprotein-sorting protein [Verrucomicrobiae bacterium]|nr:outer membrane lipoprotein-sorting protein [Verrucomicrobiae bacterium]
MVFAVAVGTVAALAITDKAALSQEDAGAAIAAELRAQWPGENVVQTGWLRIRDSKGVRAELRLKCEIVVTPTNWACTFSVLGSNTTNTLEQLRVIHSANCAGEYVWTRAEPPQGSGAPGPHQQLSWTGTRWQCAFAGSDFWAVDLGLEFLCWPHQRLLKREMRRSRFCDVLESTNPAPTPDGYSRVVSWIDTETRGIVRAEAYDANNKLLKEFEPKEFKKVSGRWELRQMRIRNVQTGSQTIFELDKSGG